MITWIKLGIPWLTRTPETPPPPNLDDKVRAKFGMTARESSDSVRDIFDLLAADHQLTEHDLSETQQSRFRFHVDLIEQINNFIQDDPEHVEHRKTVDGIFAKWFAESFCGRKLNKTGTLVKIRENPTGELQVYLLGTINCIGGMDDGYLAFSPLSIVEEYALIPDYETVVALLE